MPLLVVERSAGIAGRFTRMRVDVSGRLTLKRPPQPEITAQLDERRLALLRSLIMGAQFRSLAASYFLPGRPWSGATPGASATPG